MRLKEFQAKEIFRKYGIATPEGAMVRSPEEVEEVARALEGAVVLKPQLRVKGRGKVGGIGFAGNPREAVEEARRLFKATIHGEAVKRMLIEEKIQIQKEMYLAVTVDYAARRPLIMASDVGGIDIEEISERNPEQIIRIHTLPGEKITEALVSAAEEILGEDVAQILVKLYSIFNETSGEIVEINPLVRDVNGRLYAVDAVLNVDDDSVFKHDFLKRIQQEARKEDPIASEAKARNWTYIDLPGTIGILSSGAGLTMAIMDMIHAAGGRPANFLDTAQIDDEGIYQAFDLIMRAKPVNVLLINIFAGLNRCDLLASGIRKFLEDHRPQVPLVIRMVGNAEVKGYAVLEEIGITPFSSLEEAVSRAVELGGQP